MAIAVICPPQGAPPIEPDSDIFSRLWWLYFQRLAKFAQGGNASAICQTGMPLTDTYEDVPDCDGTLTQPGLWFILGVFSFVLIGPTENGAFGRLLVNDAPEDAAAQFGNEAGFGSATAMMFWVVNAPAQAAIRLQAKTNVTAAGRLNPDSSKLFALLIQPS